MRLLRKFATSWRHLAVLLTLVFAITLPVAFGGQGKAGSSSPDVLHATLANGLRVLIVHNGLAPVVTTNVNYLVGSEETPPDFPGTAHALEHMMFRGSPGLNADQLADIASVMGGEFNAQTRQTVTQYFYTVPAEDLEVALRIEALRMKALLLRGPAWNKERGAIEQEVAQDLSSPQYIMSTRVRAALFAGSPYAHDGLGTKSSFDATTANMLRDFHDKWYAPNNAILVIAGDVDPKATLDKVTTLFAPIPSKPLPPRKPVKLAPVVPQKLKVDSDLPYGLKMIAFRLPGIDSPDRAAAEVLADVLANERGALYALVPAGKALESDFVYEPLPKSGLAFAVAAFAPGTDPGTLESGLRSILKKIAADGVPAELVKAAKLQERRDTEFQKNSIEGLASVWSEAVAVYGLNSPQDELAQIMRVSVDDVNRVARKYLDPDHAITATLMPRSNGQPVAHSVFGGQESISLDKGKPTSLPDWATRQLDRLSAPTSRVHPVVTKLSNGITLMVQPEDVSDTVSVYGHVNNRAELQVPAGKEGLGEILDKLFPYGSVHRDRIAMLRALDEIGADDHAGLDFSLQTLREHFDDGVELLSDNLLHPAFPQDAFKVVKQQVSMSTAGEINTPGYLAHRSLRLALLPKGDPLLRQALPASVDAVTLSDVRKYYRSVFRPDLTTIVVIGKITPEQARRTIEKYFSQWKADGPRPETTLPPVPLNKATTRSIPDTSRVQSQVTLAETMGLSLKNPDYYALKLGNSVLGGAFYASRLTRDIRKDAGLVYYVQSGFQFSQTRGVYLVQYGCDPGNVTKVNNMVVAELQRMQKETVTPEELQRAKALLLRRMAISESSIADISRGLIQRFTLDQPLDQPTIAARHYIALDAQAIQRAFAKWLRPTDLVRVSVDPPSH